MRVETGGKNGSGKPAPSTSKPLASKPHLARTGAVASPWKYGRRYRNCCPNMTSRGNAFLVLGVAAGTAENAGKRPRCPGPLSPFASNKLMGTWSAGLKLSRYMAQAIKGNGGIDFEDVLSRWTLVATHDPVMDVFSDLDEDLTPRFALKSARSILIGADIHKDAFGFIRSRSGRARNTTMLDQLCKENGYEVMNIDVPTVSGVHAMLTMDREQNRYLIRDLESTNGTFLNRAKLRPNVDVRLKVGDVVAFGDLGTAWRIELAR